MVEASMVFSGEEELEKLEEGKELMELEVFDEVVVIGEIGCCVQLAGWLKRL
jgi:hypothetical protein